MKFKVGDVCVIVEFEIKELIGCEVTVVGEYERYAPHGTPAWMFWRLESGYEIEGPALPFSNEYAWMADKHQLRLKRPPSWDSWLYDTRMIRESEGIYSAETNKWALREKA